MRTTLTLDADVAARLDRYQHERRTTFKNAVNEVLRQGLDALDGPESAPPFAVEPYRGGFAPGVDPERMHALLDELEVEDAVAEAVRP